MVQSQAAARPHLRFAARGRLDDEAGGNQPRDAWLERDVLHRVQVQAGVLERSVSIRRKHGGGMNSLDSDAHLFPLS
jgi:hypothetical protein